MGSEEPPDEEGEEEEEEPGWLDLLVDVQEGFTELTDIVNEIGEKVKTVGERATATTPELQNATKSGNIRLARQILRTLGTDYAEVVVDIAKANASYETVLGKTGNALEFLLREQSRIAGTENEQVISFMAVLQDLESNALGGKESMLQLVATMNALPRMERRFDKAKRRLISELESFVENIDQTIAMVVRVRSIADESSEASKVGDI